MDPHLDTNTASHDVLELNFCAPNACSAQTKSGTALRRSYPSAPGARPPGVRKSSLRIWDAPFSTGGALASSAGAPSRAAAKPYIRYNVNSPEGQVMLAKFGRAMEIMKTLPSYDTRSWTWWWNTHWIKGYPAFLWDFSREAQEGSHRLTPAGVSSQRPRRCGTAARPTPSTQRP